MLCLPLFYPLFCCSQRDFPDMQIASCHPLNESAQWGLLGWSSSSLTRLMVPSGHRAPGLTTPALSWDHSHSLWLPPTLCSRQLGHGGGGRWWQCSWKTLGSAPWWAFAHAVSSSGNYACVHAALQSGCLTISFSGLAETSPLAGNLPQNRVPYRAQPPRDGCGSHTTITAFFHSRHQANVELLGGWNCALCIFVFADPGAGRHTPGTQ